MRRLPLFQKLLWGCSIVVIVGVIATGVITNLTLRSVEQQLPRTLLTELSDLAILLEQLSDTVTASRIYRNNHSESNLMMLKDQTNALFTGVVELRESYVVDNLVQASAFHAIVAPAVADLQIWIEEGIAEADTNRNVTSEIIFSRISKAHEKARQVNLESRRLAKDILTEQQTRLSRFIFNVNVLFALVIVITCGVLFLLIHQYRLQASQAEAQTELKRQRDLLSSLFENVDLGVTFWAGNGDLLFANRGFEEITGYSKAQISNLDGWFPLAYPDKDYRNRVMSEWQSSYAEKNAIRQFKVACNSGEVKDIEFRAVFLEDGRALVTLSDITWRVAAEQEKIQSQKLIEEHKKLSLVGQIAGKMAHDFNNILAIIMGNSELALMSTQDPEMVETLNLIFEQTIRGKNLTKNLIAFAKDQEPKQEFFNLADKVALVVNLLRKDLEGIELRVSNQDDVPDLLADPGMVEHGMVNLVQNSIHALSKTPEPWIEIRTFSSQEHICLEVEDNGCGIPDENLETVYEPSFTLKGSKDIDGRYNPEIKGTGYGMANVKKYIEQHKGGISVVSELGSGTTFTIRLPIIEKQLTRREKEEISREIVISEKHILLVEDERSLSGVQSNLLMGAPFNHRVDVVESGQAAIDKLEQETYDFISLDYMLPGTITGMGVYSHVRDTDKKIPILFISGNIEFLESIKSLQLNDNALSHLSKPCPNVDYLRAVNTLLQKSY